MDHRLVMFVMILSLNYLYSVSSQLHFENVALNGSCSMSAAKSDTGDCSKAIDNVTDLELGFISSGKPNCIHTAVYGGTNLCTPFWQVELSEEYTIYNITIYNRRGYPQRLTYTNVTVDGNLCKSLGQNKSAILDVTALVCLPGVHGRKVKISRQYPNCSSDGDFTLNLCEVQVWVCSNGWYGDRCNSACSGHCKNNATCDRRNGTCLEGCDSGWYGSTCDYPCPPNCDSHCNQTSGDCYECIDNYYGPNCTAACGRCAENNTCDRTNGNCLQCEPGWQPFLCDKECNDTHYGQNCTQTCGHCFDGQACNKTTGICKTCKPGWEPPYCTTEQTTLGSFSETPSGVIIGCVIGAVVVFVAVAAIFIYSKRRTSAKRSGPIEMFQTNVMSSNKKGENRERQNSDLNEKTIQGEDVANLMYVNVSAVHNFSVSGGKISDNVSRGEKNTINDDYDDYDQINDIYNTEDVYSTYEPVILWDAFQKSILSSLASGQLGNQFKNLPKGLQRPHLEGLKPENTKKNRFKALFPYDDTRIILHRSSTDNESDYINASYIKGYKRDHAYIATQGPRAHTVNDLWLMVWQENTTQIIMLTNLKENGKDKCEEYWPAVGTSHGYGSVVVCCINEETRADYSIKTFTLKRKGNPLEHQVQHYHYVAWPDHGVPSATSLVDFWRYVRAHALPTSPAVVHCSAGVGRTGTYIALDIAMDLVADGRDVNVLKIVTDLREDRTDMVQTEAQYKFLHEVIFEAYTSLKTRLTCEEFDGKFPQPVSVTSPSSTIDREFKILQMMGEFLPKPTYTVSQKDENIARCRNPNALPDDSHLVYLSGSHQRNTYINAVFQSSFKQHKGFLLTQLPLTNTLVDFWRLVDEYDVSIIVSLGCRYEDKVVKDYCQYWPVSVGEVMTIGQYDIKLSTSSEISDHLSLYTIIVKNNNNKTVELRVLRLTSWASEVPEDTTDLIYLFETLSTYRAEKASRPVLVQCLDGAAKCGLFCVMSVIFDRVTCDHVIDVFLSARHMQAVKPRVITNEVQYRYCYKLAQDIKRHQGVYENT